jgi:hypothetical protein
LGQSTHGISEAFLGQWPQPNELAARIAGLQSEAETDSMSYRDAMEAYRRRLILRALSQTQGNRAEHGGHIRVKSKTREQRFHFTLPVKSRMDAAVYLGDA